jgi:predicted nucleotidyltransferase
LDVGGLEVIDPRFQALYDRAVAVLTADPRVLEVRASGSVGAGTADRWSDLDLEVITDPDQHDAFLADRDTWLAAITPTVFARTPIAPMVINTVTDEGLTLDLAVWPGESPVWPTPPVRYGVGVLSGKQFEDLGEALEYAVAEQLRGMNGPLISLIQREEHLRHLTGVTHLLGLLTTVFLAETGSVPPAKHWNGTYTEEQRAAVAALPPVSATREGLLAFGMGLAELVLTRARPLFARYGQEWPTDLARVTAQRVEDQLGLDIRAWCY